ncbi:Phosphomannomutase 1 [Didymella pomorum]|uniref:Phosphomannomutase n=1 Tax=Didymella pomorum TaxID=749634 RepID=A0A9W8ZP02_9PLEO|nr:Phosphomannomutase 1 [Didymella pomorum]
MAAAASVYPPLNQRPVKNTVFLFDVDDTLTKPRQLVKPEMLQLLSELRHKVAIGFVGGSNLAKQQEQLATADINVTSLFDFCFAENGLTAYRLGEQQASQSFIGWIGQEKYNKLVKWILHYIADLDIPIKRGTFVEFRNGMINVSPIGRNASTEERNEYQKYDIEHDIRPTMVRKLKEEFPDYGLTYSIGGQISFDVFPTGWDKTYCLNFIAQEKDREDGVDYQTIHFFGDKTYKGGNDYEIYSDERTIGHSVKNPDDTYAQLQELLKSFQQ